VAAGKFLKAAASLLKILGDDSALVGGMAVNAHGFVRATRDVDVMIGGALSEARRRLEAAGVKARLFKEQSLDGDFTCLKGVLGVGPEGDEAVPFDVLPALVPLVVEKLVALDVGGLQLRVVDPDTLFRLKLKAGAPRDLYDIAILSNLHPEWAELALALAAGRGARQAERMAVLIRDPQVQRQVEEVRRQDETLRAFALRASRRRRRP
jgi:hypothetical protein